MLGHLLAAAEPPLSNYVTTPIGRTLVILAVLLIGGVALCGKNKRAATGVLVVCLFAFAWVAHNGGMGIPTGGVAA